MSDLTERENLGFQNSLTVLEIAFSVMDLLHRDRSMLDASPAVRALVSAAGAVLAEMGWGYDDPDPVTRR